MSRAWPPTAHRQGVDLPIAALIGIVLGLFVVLWLAWTAIAGPWVSVVGWQYEPSPSAVVRQLIAPSVVELALWLAILTALGWRRAAGLVVGSLSPWGVVPLVLFWAVTLLAAGLSDVVSKGAASVLLAAVGYFVAALSEEIACRGFLLHGFTRRFGGTGGVLLSSAVFASLHIPTLLVQGHPYVGAALVGFFGFGVTMCRVRVATGSLWFPTAIHALYNLTITGIVVWAFPEGQAPTVYVWLARGFSMVGLLLALGLVLRSYATRAFGRLVSTSSRGSDRDGHLPAPDWWRTEVDQSAFEMFTPAARRVIVQAEREARAEQGRSIGTEHLLLGLLHQSDGVAARAFEAIGLSVGPRGRLEELLGGNEGPTPPTLPLQHRTKLVLQLAIREADERGHDDVPPECILLALTAIRAGEAFRVLRSSGVDPAHLRRYLVRLMTEAAWRESSVREDGDLERVSPPVRPQDRAAGTFDGFPEPIRSILDIANAEARATGSSALGTRHLLSALCREREGIVVTSLRAAGLPPAVVPATHVDTARAPEATLPLTPRAKRSLEGAIKRADEMRAAHVAPEHVLLALVDEHRGEAAQMLAGAGVDLDRLRTVAIGLSEPGSVSDEESEVAVRSPEG